MFGDYFYNVARDTGISSISNKVLDGDKDFNGFQLRRIYFTYDYNISNIFDTRFRLEAEQEPNTTSGKVGVVVKDAYLKWKNIFEGSDLYFGIIPTPANQISEDMWGYRSIEKMIPDLRGIVSTRDIAVSLKGKVIPGTLNYWVMLGNGNSNRPESDKYKRIYTHLHIIPIKNLQATIYGDLKLKGKIQYGQLPDHLFNNLEFTSALFIGYKEEGNFMLGAEGILLTRQNGNIKSIDNGFEVTDRNTFGISLFGAIEFDSLIGVLGRFDYYDPNFSSQVKGDSRNYFILGLNYRPEKMVNIMPNILIETYEKPVSGIERDLSLTARITFAYSFN